MTQEPIGEKHLAISLLLSIAIHATVLFVRWHGGGDGMQAQQLAGGKTHSPKLQVSLGTTSASSPANMLTVPGIGIEQSTFADAVPVPDLKPVPAQPLPAPQDQALPPAPINTPRRGLGLVAEHYRRPSELTEPPYPLTVGSLDFDDQEIGPAGARFAVEVFINENGGVDEAEIVHGYAPPALRERAKRVFGETRYQPGLWRKSPVKSRVLIELYLPPRLSANTGSEVAMPVTGELPAATR